MLQSSQSAGQRPAEYTSREKAYRLRMGDRGYERFENLKRQERQRVWDNMRRIAAARYRDGLMPEWFKPEWLDIEEAPTNTWWRHQGLSAYQYDTTWLGENAPDAGSGGGSSSSGGTGGSGSNGNNGIWPRWWREEDPYWPLRDWGDHPMRWWTWGLAGVMAAGGVIMHSSSGDPAAVFIGLGSAALLGMAAVAMSDMQGTGGGANVLGELGVKAAFAICAIMAFNEFSSPQGMQPQQQQHYTSSWSQQHQQQHWSSSSSNPGFKGTGWACLCMALMYMYTGMSGLAHYSLPSNPGEAFKMVDIAEKHKIWEYWGYGSLTMRS